MDDLKSADHADTSTADAEEIDALRESVRRWVERDYGFDKRSAASREPQGFAQAHWQSFAELGWLAIGLPEEHGGFGGLMAQVALAEELGRALAVEPWLANAALAGPLLAQLGGPARAPLVESMIAGQTRFALAAFERQGRHDAFDVQTRAQTDAQGWVLDGRKTLALGAGAADQLLVLARTSGQPRDLEGLSLFLVPAHTTGLSLKALPTYDRRQTADVTLENVRVPGNALLGPQGGAWPAVAAALDRATVMLCAESVGAMDRCLRLTRDYLSTRKQFGKLITDNQVIRHRLVDLLVATEQARAITEQAAMALSGDANQRQRAVSLAKAFVSSAGRRVGEDAVQLHGAVGMTDDLEVGHAYRRLAAAANLFGDAEWHQQRLAVGSLGAA